MPVKMYPGFLKVTFQFFKASRNTIDKTTKEILLVTPVNYFVHVLL